MKKCDLKRINEAPQSGTILVYSRKSILFENYNSLDELSELIGDEEILELHAFDENKEYRAISSTSRRWRNGKIEQIIDFDKAEAFVVSGKTENGFSSVSEKLTMLNHLQFDEAGNMYVDNYRLSIRG